MGPAEAKGAVRDDKDNSGGEEEKELLVCKFHSTVLSKKLYQTVHWATYREGGGCLLLDDLCANIGRPVA